MYKPFCPSFHPPTQRSSFTAIAGQWTRLPLYMCIYVYIRICILTCIYVCVCVYVYIYTSARLPFIDNLCYHTLSHRHALPPSSLRCTIAIAVITTTYHHLQQRYIAPTTTPHPLPITPTYTTTKLLNYWTSALLNLLNILGELKGGAWWLGDAGRGTFPTADGQTARLCNLQ
jgi:hypothetical protein